LIKNHKNNKILIFSSPTQIEALSKASHWYADGTFRTAAKHYYQLYIIHAYVNKHMVPCCFALMNRRRTCDYNIVLKSIKSEATSLNLVLDPKYIMTDFEMAAINSFKENFPGIMSKGCLFHFVLSLMKKMNNLGLKSHYQNDENVANWFKMVCCLSLIPIDEVNDFFLKILAIRPNIQNTEKLMDYFVGTYFEGSFDLAMWNHFDTKDTPRTNNNLEGYNLKLNSHLCIAKPDIYKVIAKLFNDQVLPIVQLNTVKRIETVNILFSFILFFIFNFIYNFIDHLKFLDGVELTAYYEYFI
jgi:hypothetical protein